MRLNIKIDQNPIGEYSFYSFYLGLFQYVANLMLEYIVGEIKLRKYSSSDFGCFETRKQDRQHPCRVIVLLMWGRVSRLLLLHFYRLLFQLLYQLTTGLVSLCFWILDEKRGGEGNGRE